MHKLHELKESLCAMLEEYEGREITSSSLEAIDTLAHAIKNIDKIIESYEEAEYSGRSYRGSSYRDDRMDMRGMSRAQRRDARGRYSSTTGYSRTEDMVEELHELMREAPEHTRGEFRKFIDRIETMK